jgi:hypothetical protein
MCLFPFEPILITTPFSLLRHKPAYFEEDISSGKPVLSEQGRKAVEAELERARREVG